jgi:endonuclease III
LRRIANNMDRVRQQVYGVYRHQRKVEAMVDMAGVLHRNPGIGSRLEQMGVESALDYMQTLDGIGKVTKYHLARNIGFDVVKPDRHLSRLADVMGTTPTELCQAVRRDTGERIGAVDFVLYQWCAWAGFDHVAEQVKAIC